MDKFRKSSFSKPRPPTYGGCVYVSMQKEVIAVRKNFGGHTVRFTPYEWGVFIKGVKNGEFDLADW